MYFWHIFCGGSPAKTGEGAAPECLKKTFWGGPFAQIQLRRYMDSSMVS